MSREIRFISTKDSVRHAAKVMRKHNVGVLTVFDGRRPVGVVTDRDLTLRVLAEGTDPERLSVSEIMTHRPMCLRENQSLKEAIDVMTQQGITRLLVRDEYGMLTGILSATDVAIACEDANDRMRLLQGLSRSFTGRVSALRAAMF